MKYILETDFDKTYEELSSLLAEERNFILPPVKLSSIHGFEFVDDIVKKIESGPSLLDYVDIDSTIADNLVLTDVKPEDWVLSRSPDNNFIYTINCPRCHLHYSISGADLNSRISGCKKSVKKFGVSRDARFLALCPSCAQQEKIVDGKAKEAPDLPQAIVNMIHPSIYQNGELTNNALDIIYDLNKDNQLVSKDYLNALLNSNNFDIRKLPIRSKLILKWKCPIHGDEYDASVSKVTTEAKGSHGCPKCLADSIGAQESKSEYIIADIIAAKLPEAHIKKGYEIPGFKPVDVFVEYNGNKYGIEYDGIGRQRKAHITADQINTDIRKTNAMKALGMQVIRIRESECYPWQNDGTIIITLPNSKSAINLSSKQLNALADTLVNYIKEE